MSGIVMNSTPANVATNSTPVIQDWGFNPSSAVIDYYQGQDAMPEPIIVGTRFKDVMGTPAVANLTDLRYRTYIGASSLPQCVTMAGDYYTGPTIYQPLNSNGNQTEMTYTFQNLNLLATGTFNFDAYHQIWGKNAGGFDVYVSEKIFRIKVRVFPADAPVVSPQSIAFARTIGSQNNDSFNFQISGVNWVVRCPYGFKFMAGTGVTLTAVAGGGFEASGTGLKSFGLLCTPDVEPATITENPINLALVVNGGIITVPIRITFGQANGLYLSTQYITFTSYKGSQEAEPVLLNVYYNGNYKLQTQPLMYLSQTTASYNSDILITPLYSGNLDEGTYYATVFIHDTDTNILIGSFIIRYIVVDMAHVPYPENEYAFTLENKFIEFLSQYDDSTFDVVMKAKIFPFYSNTFREVSIPFKVALFKKRQTLNVSHMVHRIMDEMPDLAQDNSIPYLPAEISLSITERRSSDPSYSRNMIQDNIFFVAGLNPGLVAGSCILDINQNSSRVTASGYAYLNMLISGYPTLRILRNGVEISTTVVAPGIKTFRINFSQLGAAAGDEIEYKFEFDDAVISKVFRVFPEGYNSNFIVWENEYKLKSVLEFTGKYQVKSDFENRTAAVQVELVDVLRKIENTKVAKLTINTGFLSRNDIATVESLSRAKRAALVLPGQVINLVPITKTLLSVDDDRELISFDIEFEINRTYNEEIYSF
jgi:hypothetical protein